MAELTSLPRLSLDRAEQPMVAASAAAGFAALFSAAACCVLPIAFALAGLGASGLAAFVPYHWPLTIASGLAVAAGWTLYFRKRRACSAHPSCKPRPPKRSTLVLLCFATMFVALSAVWKALFEAPLQSWLLNL